MHDNDNNNKTIQEHTHNTLNTSTCLIARLRAPAQIIVNNLALKILNNT